MLEPAIAVVVGLEATLLRTPAGVDVGLTALRASEQGNAIAWYTRSDGGPSCGAEAGRVTGALWLVAGDQLIRDLAHGVARDRESDAGGGSAAELGIGRGERRDPDHLVRQVHERATRVAGVDRGARLDRRLERHAVALRDT